MFFYFSFLPLRVSSSLGVHTVPMEVRASMDLEWGEVGGAVERRGEVFQLLMLKLLKFCPWRFVSELFC